MSDGFDRIHGDRRLKRRAVEDLADLLGVASFSDVSRAMDELTDMAERGELSDSQVEHLDQAASLVQRLEAFDRPWVFGQRYMGHKFSSTDPICTRCLNEVPHRTILVCPTCGEMGPWSMEEHSVRSSYVHYFLVEQVTRLLNNSLLIRKGTHYADGTLTAMPRGGAKSTWLCEIVGAWLVLTGRSRCLLLLSNTVDQVTERCNEIRTELEENPLIIEDFGIQAASRQSNRTWTKSDFTLPNRSRVVARGAMQSMRGVKNREYRPDAVISDDSDDEKFLTTPDQATKMWEWWDTRVVPACHPNAVYMLHGTVIGEMGLLWQSMKGHRGTTSAKRVFKAVQDRAGCEKCGMPTDLPGSLDCPVCAEKTKAVRPCSYWGARFTVPALQATKNKIGHWAFSTEFQQEPHDDSTSWFAKDWLDRANRENLAPLEPSARRILPWAAIECTLTGHEAVQIATMADPSYAMVPGDLGPYQAIVQSWDPAWAREKGKEQMTAWMAGVGMGLTWDDRFDIFWIDRDRGKSSNTSYREWMYNTWRRDILPATPMERPGQLGMIVEQNAAGVLFQYDLEEHWGAMPMISHQTGAEKHDLTNGIPGLASAFESNRVVIRSGGSSKQRELAEELMYELKHSGRSQYKDLLMATWFAWAYLSRWMRDIRDPARYNELARRRMAGVRDGELRPGTH